MVILDETVDDWRLIISLRSFDSGILPGDRRHYQWRIMGPSPDGCPVCYMTGWILESADPDGSRTMALAAELLAKAMEQYP